MHRRIESTRHYFCESRIRNPGYDTFVNLSQGRRSWGPLKPASLQGVGDIGAAGVSVFREKCPVSRTNDRSFQELPSSSQETSS